MSDEDESGWRRTGTALPFATPWFRIRRDEITLPSGEDVTFHSVEHDGWAQVVPLTPAREVVMERVYRWSQRRAILECPAGALDGDAPELAARRELEEETGYRAERFIHLGRFLASSGYTNEAFDSYLALDAQPTGVRQLEATEQIELELVPFDALRARVTRGELEDGPSSLAILLAAEQLAREGR